MPARHRPSRPADGTTRSRYLLPITIGTVMALLAAPTALAQGLTVLPVNILLAPGQMAATLTVISQTDHEMAFQVRTYSWTQQGGTDQLSPTEDLLASPPLGTIPAGATQVVRLVLRRQPQGQETTYRILLDQIPPPAAPGIVRVALRLSIPVFAEPTTRAAPHLQWHIERGGGQASLVAVNDGKQHETVRDISLTTPAGAALKVAGNVSPYVLAGATHSWRILSAGAATAGGLRLTAHADAGTIDQPVTAGGP